MFEQNRKYENSCIFIIKKFDRCRSVDGGMRHYDGFDIEKLIAAWPDENGQSSDPETYHRYREALKAELRRRILVALGAERIDRITPPQREKLEVAFEELFHSKSVFEINEADIFETYYSVVCHA